MTKQEVEKLYKELLAREAELVFELQGIADMDPAVKGNWKARFNKIDPSESSDEQAHSVEDYETDRSIEQTLEEELKNVREALVRIRSDAYGHCSNCDKLIEEKRLRAVPVANLCLNCARRATLV